MATPGRMNDFVSKNRISFASVRYVVLDEADRMLDMGFLPAIEQMMNHETMVPTVSHKFCYIPSAQNTFLFRTHWITKILTWSFI